MSKLIPVTILAVIFPLFAHAQTFTFTTDTLTRYAAPGSLIILDAEIRNISEHPLHVRISRLQNNVPPGWSTSLCSGSLCYPPNVDAYTVPDSLVGIPPLAAGDTLDFHLNFNTDPTIANSASIPIRVANIDDSTEFVELTFSASTQPISGLRENGLPVTGDFRLYGNYPNPFNPSTKIRFEIGGHKSVLAQLNIYNAFGQRIAVLLKQTVLPGNYELNWNARNRAGRTISSGLYFCELQAGQFRDMRKMALVK